MNLEQRPKSEAESTGEIIVYEVQQLKGALDAGFRNTYQFLGRKETAYPMFFFQDSIYKLLMSVVEKDTKKSQLMLINLLNLIEALREIATYGRAKRLANEMLEKCGGYLDNFQMTPVQTEAGSVQSEAERESLNDLTLNSIMMNAFRTNMDNKISGRGQQMKPYYFDFDDKGNVFQV